MRPLPVSGVTQRGAEPLLFPQSETYMRYFYETINIPVRPKGRHHQHSKVLAELREQIIFRLA